MTFDTFLKLALGGSNERTQSMLKSKIYPYKAQWVVMRYKLHGLVNMMVVLYKPSMSNILGQLFKINEVVS